ncbi:hypothetical protein T06_5075 [Trichinella sp. T6]|nr:hypothetical protein T06_5075 [Trichinella sp. T6]
MSVFCIRLTRNGFNDKQLSEIRKEKWTTVEKYLTKLSLKKSITHKLEIIHLKWRLFLISFFAGAIGDDEYFYKNKVLKSSCDLQLKFASI